MGTRMSKPSMTTDTEQHQEQVLEDRVVELEKANSGLYAELKSTRVKLKDSEAALQIAAEKLQAAQPDKAEADPDDLDFMRQERDQAIRLADEAYDKLDKLVADRAQPAPPVADPDTLAHGLRALEESAGPVRAQHPDFDAVMAEARDIRHRLMAASHPHWSDQDVQGSIELGDAMNSLQSLQAGVSPAARAFEIASRIVQALRPSFDARVEAIGDSIAETSP